MLNIHLNPLVNILYDEKNNKNKIELYQISTQSGIIPKEINKLGVWGDRRAGDFDFYKSIEDKVYRVQYQDEAIYIIRPQLHKFVLVRGDDVPG